MDYLPSTFWEGVQTLTGMIITTGETLYRIFFYSIKDWLRIYPEDPLFDWLTGIANLLGLDWLINFSFVSLIFSPKGMWIIFTILLVYFFIP